MSRRRISTITNQDGTLSDGTAPPVHVRFSLTQWQDYIDGTIPSLKSGTGTIEFPDTGKAFYYFNSGVPATLRGGGLEAQILMETLTEFVTTGPIEAIKP